MRKAILLVMALLPVMAAASDRGGHMADVGLLLYGQDSDRGGALVEGRWNLTPEELDSALYVTGGLGMGSWYSSNKPSFWQDKSDNYVAWRNLPSTFMDLGLGLTYGRYTGGLGLFLQSYDLRAVKVQDTVVTYENISGSKTGLYIQGGYEIPMGKWFLDFLVGYRQTRGEVELKKINKSIKPVAGFYARTGMRYRF